MRWMCPAALALLVACDDGEKVNLLETGWFEDDTDNILDTDGGTVCLGKVLEVEPADGEDAWFWRDGPRLFVETVSNAYAVRLTDTLGRVVPTTLVPTDEAGLKLEAQFEGGLEPNTDYLLEVDDCFETRRVAFRTSSYGAPLNGGPRSLLGRTYLLDLVGADWIEPGGFGPILSTTFTTPVLLGVQYADANNMDWIGATGYVSVGQVQQDDSYPTWDFPVTPFDGAPYFATTSARVELIIAGFALPITDFHLSGTLAADASHFAGGVLSGLGDTRYAGGAIAQPNNPAAMCNLAAGIGVSCVACPDGEPLCLQVELHDLRGTEVDGLTLVPVLPED
jgi:hypothetical protein